MNGKRGETTGMPGNTSPRTALSRRRLITLLAAGGASPALATLPDSWTPPVVDSVLLPAHAQTTGGNPDIVDLQDGFFILPHGLALAIPDNSILDYFVATARAADTGIVVACLTLVNEHLFIDALFDIEQPVSGEFDVEQCRAQNADDIPSGGAPLGGSANVPYFTVVDGSNDANCSNALNATTLEFLSVSGAAPNRMVTVKITIPGNPVNLSQTLVCPETDESTCEGSLR